MELCAVKSVFSMGQKGLVFGLFLYLESVFRLLLRLGVWVAKGSRLGGVHLVCCVHSTCRSF